tara:strand:- start:5826 stop:6110 length:285 start_codon:yes stop_codon:yes gene_type:complete
MKFSIEEIEKSKRIFKSATPKYTVDWYLKWVASVFVLVAMSYRGINSDIDLYLSIVGIGLWLIVSIIWNDRALITVNGVGLILLVNNLMEKLYG